MLSSRTIIATLFIFVKGNQMYIIILQTMYLIKKKKMCLTFQHSYIFLFISGGGVRVLDQIPDRQRHHRLQRHRVCLRGHR